MRLLQIALLCTTVMFGVGVSGARALTLQLLPISATQYDPVVFSFSISLTAPSSGNGTVLMSQFQSYCWAVNGDGQCRSRPGFNDGGYVTLQSFLPVAWVLDAEQTPLASAWISLSGGPTNNRLDGRSEMGASGLANLTTCPWEDGCYSASVVPVPAALPLLGSVLGAMGVIVGWRRRTKQI